MARTIINRLSDRRVKTAKAGMHPDGGGLYLRVTEGKEAVLNRYWLFRYARRDNGNDRQLGIGSLDTVTLAAARAAARECREQLLAGLDPVEQRELQRASQALADVKTVTFDQAVERYIASHESAWKNAKHRQQWRNTLATYASPVIGSLPVGAIDTGLVMQVLEPIWTAKRETASRLRGRVEVVLDWAKVRGYRTGENPARWRGHLDKLLPKKPKGRKVKHHPALPYAQIGAFMANLRPRAGTAAKALQFTILTAARSDEVISMRWHEIDLAEKLWTVPPERIKGEREHCVPLSDQAAAIIREMKPDGENVGQKYVFPGAKPGRPLSNMAMLELIRRMNAEREVVGQPKWTDPKQGDKEVVTHGFRSTFKTWSSERTTFRDAVSESCLAHIEGDKVKAAYDRATFEQHRCELMEMWSAWCASTPGEAAKVVVLRSA